MGLDEDAGDADGDRRPGQHRHEFPSPARGLALPARLLHRMGGVEHHRTSDLGHDRQGAHVGDQAVVAEGHAPLAGQHIGIAGARHLGDDVLHVPGRQELALLHIHRPPRPRSGHQKVGLAAEEGGDLQHVDRFGDRGALVVLVHVGHGGQTQALADLGEDRKRRLEAHAAAGGGGGAVGLVEGTLVDEPDPAPFSDLLQRLGGLQRMGAALHRAGPRDHGQRQGVADSHRRAVRRLHLDDLVGFHPLLARDAFA